MMAAHCPSLGCCARSLAAELADAEGGGGALAGEWLGITIKESGGGRAEMAAFVVIRGWELGNFDAPGCALQRPSLIRGNVRLSFPKVWQIAVVGTCRWRLQTTTPAVVKASISVLLRPASASNSWVCWPSRGGACR